MIQLPNNMWLCERVEDLPQLSTSVELFADVETERVFDHPDYGGLYTWKGDRIAGIAVTADDDERCWYVPVRHRSIGSPNLPLEAYQRWLADLLYGPGDWINHNILLDAAFADADGATPYRRLIDTLTLSKMHYTDRMEYGLKPLCRDWLNMPMDEANEIKAYLKGINSKSYADLPADMAARYACMDVRANRMLYRYLEVNRPQQMDNIWATEIALTYILFDAEKRGLRVDPQELKVDKLKGLGKMINLSSELVELTGREYTNSVQCAYDIIVNQLGLPVLATKWEKDEVTGRKYDTGRPSFDKDAMKLYTVHPQVVGNEKNNRVIQLIMAYKKEAQHQGLFVEPFLLLKDAHHKLHPTYNQIVRTGRMSCKRPNAQQQNKRSKGLIHPDPGRCFISCDASQIEFRLIVHFTNDRDAIDAYLKDPFTDFHMFVANSCGMKRKAGKTMNFRIGYGAGKRNIEGALAADPDIIEEIGLKLAGMENSNELFHKMCNERAAELYQTYHEKFPGIKRVSKDAETTVKRRGFLFNPAGRRRHLEAKFAHKGFNSLVQGYAMDIIKAGMVRTSSVYNKKMRDWDIHIVANVHDEILYDAPVELMLNTEVHEYILSQLEIAPQPLRVPLIFGMGVSSTSWAEAAGDDTVYDESGVKKAGKLR